MKDYQVQLSRRARRELALIRAWWRVNRPAAPDLLDREMADVRELLGGHPTAGAVSRDRELTEILTVWHAKRRAPQL